MADLKLKSIQIRNWMKFENVSLKFPEKGLVVVTGQNSASGGSMQSVGSGKTGFGEAICHALLGISSHFDRVGRYSKDKLGDTYVCLEAEFLGKPLKVEMGYKCKELNSTGEALQYTYGDSKPKSRGRMEQTRADLLQLLGVSQMLARWTVFVDGDDLKFNKLTQADSVDLVMSALRQPPWTEYHENSKKVLGKFKQAIAKDEASHAAAQKQVKETEQDIESAQETVNERRAEYAQKKAHNDKVIKEHQTKIAALDANVVLWKAERTTIAKKIDESVQSKAEANHALEVQFNEITERIQTFQTKKRSLVHIRDAALQEYANADMAAENYEKSGAAKNCPTCRRPMAGTQLDPEHLQHLKESALAAKAVLDAKEAEYFGYDDKIKAQQAQLQKNREETKALGAEEEVATLSERDEELETSIHDAETSIHHLELVLTRLKVGVPDTALKQAEATLSERQRVLEQAKETVATTSAELASSRSMLQALEYWNLAFSPYGIPNMVLRDAIAPLNKEAKRVSTVMTGGTIEVTYSTQRELASGMEKAQLVVEVDNKLGSQDLQGSSKGEAGSTNFIIAETLSEVGQVSRRIGFLWLDEVLPNQDPVVCKSVYSYLKQKAEKLGILIFLVDHNPASANYADKILLIEKSGDTSKCASRAMWL